MTAVEAANIVNETATLRELTQQLLEAIQSSGVGHPTMKGSECCALAEHEDQPVVIYL